jgi:hypothetical protein
MPIDVGSRVQVSTKSLDKVNVFSSGSKTCQMCEKAPYGPSFRNLVSVFLSLMDSKMSPTQKLVLASSVAVLKHREMSLTALADLVSRRTGVPYSTVKWNIRALVAMGFLVGGDVSNRGEPAMFTEVGVMLVEHLGPIP